MYVLKLKELKANLTQQKIQKGNVASVTASYELSQMIVINGKSYTEGDFIKQYFAKMAEIVVHKRHACSKIFHWPETFAELNIRNDLKQHLKAESLKFEHLQLMRPLISLE